MLFRSVNVADTNVPLQTLGSGGVLASRVGPTGCGITVTATDCGLPGQPFEVVNTVRVYGPPAVVQLTTTSVVPCPEMIVPPEDIDQVYTGPGSGLGSTW